LGPLQDFSAHPGRGHYRNFNQKSDFAILNWDDEALVSAMKDVLKFWLDKRVDGFYFGEVQYLAMNKDGKPVGWGFGRESNRVNVATFLAMGQSSPAPQGSEQIHA